MSDDYFYETAAGHGLPHDPFKAIVAPRPIGWIGTVDLQGRPNLAPFSFFNAVNSRPPIIAFSNETQNDTLRNVRATGEFVYNMVSADLAAQMNITAAPEAPGVNEMSLAGLEAAPCRLVKPPRVARSPAAFECKVLQVLSLTDLAGAATPATLVLGQVVAVHIRRDYLKDGEFDTVAAAPLARMGHISDYSVARELFEMPRPMEALSK